MTTDKLTIWTKFCDRYMGDTLKTPLFETTSEGIVEIKLYGRNDRLLLKRSKSMENLLIGEVSKVLDDYHESGDIYEGLIYMMYKMNDDLVVPLYIGKSEKFGKKGDNLSANISNIRHNKAAFCRWGDNYAYHIGDLSAVVCPGHPDQRKARKYQKWATSLFESYPTDRPKLKEDVYFWIHAWQTESMGVFQEFGGTPLTALEYQLISVAATLFPEDLLNQDGVNRGQKYIWFILFNIYSEMLLHQFIYKS